MRTLSQWVLTSSSNDDIHINKLDHQITEIKWNQTNYNPRVEESETIANCEETDHYKYRHGVIIDKCQEDIEDTHIINNCGETIEEIAIIDECEEAIEETAINHKCGEPIENTAIIQKCW